jgi:hypothetical protein
MDYDASEITGLISAVSLCDDCLAHKTGLLVRRVQGVLNQIARSADLATNAGRCAGCLKQTVVHRLR